MDTVRLWTPRALALGAFALYALAAPSGVYWLDSGELSAAGARLGVSHPTGFPLWIVAAKAATLVPLGEVAFRINLLSALCAALAVLWVARLVLSACRDDASGIPGAIGAGAALAVSLVFARQATVAEVYAPTAAALAGALLLVVGVARGGGRRAGVSLAIASGLGLALHTTFALLGPVVIALLLVRLRRGARWPLVAPLVVACVAGGLYAQLPVRSETGRIAAVDWGHARTAGSLWDHVSASRVRRAYDEEMRSSRSLVVAANARTFAGQLQDAFGPLGLMAALAGLVALARARRTRWLAAAVASLIAGDALYAVWINPMGLVDLQNGVPLSVGLAVCAGVGIAVLARATGRAAPYVGTVTALIVAAPMALVSVPEVWAGRSGDLPRRLAERALAATPPGGIVLSESDSLSAQLMFLTAVEGARPDVAALVRQHLADGERVLALVERTTPRQADVFEFLSAAVGRPVVVELGQLPLPAGRDVVVGTPVSRLVPAGEGTHAVSTAAAELAALARAPGARDRAARRALASAMTDLGRVAYAGGDDGAAALLFRAALEIRPQHAVAWSNLGAVSARARDVPQAIAHTERALAVEPNRVAALVNVARYYLRAGDDARAEARIARALALDDDRADAWAIAALVDFRAGRRERAMQRLERARALDPRDPDVIDLMRQLRRR